MGGNVLKLRSDYHDLREVVMIYIRDDIERQVDHMCTCGEAIARKNLQKGIEQEHEQGLKAMVQTLKPFCKTFDELYEKITSNEVYRYCTRDQILKYYR